MTRQRHWWLMDGIPFAESFGRRDRNTPITGLPINPHVLVRDIPNYIEQIETKPWARDKGGIYIRKFSKKLDHEMADLAAEVGWGKVALSTQTKVD